MKAAKNILGFSLALLMLTGCEKFLELTPDSEYSVAGAYKTQNDFEQAIAGVYAQLQVLYAPNANWLRGVIARGDDTKRGGLYLAGLDNFIDNDVNEWCTPSWNNHWKLVNLTNLILDKIDAASFSDENLRKSIKGEAFMLRAYAYWSLGWQFGGMPRIDKVISTAEIRKIPRSTQEETFGFAAADYKAAIELLPDQWDSKRKGRVTKNAARGMLARLYLFSGNFTAAKPELEAVINSGLYDMESEYVNCFTDSHDNGKERVFEVQFTGGQLGEGHAFATGNLPEGFNDPAIMPFSGYSTAMRVSEDLYNSYEKGDKRRDVSILKGWVSNAGVKDTVSMYFIKYTHFDTYTPKAQSDWANNLPVLRYTDVLLMYAEVLNELQYTASGEALTLLNRVRNRAGLPAYTAASLPSQAAFRHALIRERRVEFAFEGLRWPDMIRWGTAEKTMNAFLASPLEGNGLYSMKPHQKLFAIPFDELSRYNDTQVLWQNDGY